MKFSGPKGPSIVYLDIGGNREEAGVIEMMSWVLSRSFSNLRMIVIKSREVIHTLKNNSTTAIDAESGIVQNGSAWFQEKLMETRRRKESRHLHPLQAPLVYSPCDTKQPICRYHNYDPKGCKKASNCPLDHDHCHLCLRKGHRAIDCKSTVSDKGRAEIQSK